MTLMMARTCTNSLWRGYKNLGPFLVQPWWDEQYGRTG